MVQKKYYVIKPVIIRKFKKKIRAQDLIKKISNNKSIIITENKTQFCKFNNIIN